VRFGEAQRRKESNAGIFFSSKRRSEIRCTADEAILTGISLLMQTVSLNFAHRAK